MPLGAAALPQSLSTVVPHPRSMTEQQQLLDLQLQQHDCFLYLRTFAKAAFGSILTKGMVTFQRTLSVSLNTGSPVTRLFQVLVSLDSSCQHRSGDSADGTTEICQAASTLRGCQRCIRHIKVISYSVPGLFCHLSIQGMKLK